MSDDLNSFIRNRVTVKSNDFKSLFGNGKHFKPYINIGMRFDLGNSRVTSSEAVLPTLLNIALAQRKKDFLRGPGNIIIISFLFAPNSY